MKSSPTHIIFIIFLVCVFFKSESQTTNISGVINNYASVTIIGSQSVSAPSANGFIVGDKVLLIQMKGATIDTTNTLNFGIITSYNDAGNYEMLIISAISSSTITFTTPFLKTYNTIGLVQLVNIPVYNNVNVIGNLTCSPWNGLKGGVLVFEATGNVNLNANIDVTGKGFLGGAKAFGQFISCAGNTTGFKLPSSSLISANKGEGIMIIKPSFAKGLGALANGGGAGNDVNGGGAGGGNLGTGGRGGSNKCSTSPSAICGGYGGKSCVYSNMNNKIFLGGGGGAGHENDGVSTGGVSGGGIIIIRSGGSISGNGNFINANGNNNTLIAGNDGQGGGGAGGAILIEACSTTSLNISVKGGYGGTDNFTGPDCHGKGGGGGGGIIWTSSSLTYTSFFNGGNPGVFTNPASQCFNTSNGATMGQIGGTLSGLSIPGAVPFSSGTFSLTTTSSNNIICAGTTVTLTANGAVTYTWSTGSINSSVIVSPTVTTTYTVTGSMPICSGTNITSTAITITVIPSQTITITPTLSSICSSQTTTLTVSGANSYSWINSSTLSGSTGSVVIASPQVTTTYTVTGIVGSCTNSAVVTVSVVSQPVITINSSTTSICLGASLTLTANGAPSYSWTPNVNATNTTSSIVDVNPSINTSYTVIGGVGTCSNSAIVTVNVIQNPIIAVSDKTICAGNTETLSATGAASYSWSPSLGLSSINGQTVIVNPLSTQMYLVNGTFTNGCIGNASALVTVINNPTISVSASSSAICAGQSSSLTAIGAPSFTWSPAISLTNVNGSQTIATPIATQTYIVVGSSGVSPNSCSSTKAIEIKVLPKVIASVSPNTSFCQGSNTTLYASGGTIYSWSPTFNVTKPNDSVTIVKPATSTIYTVTVSRNGLCPSSSSATVEVVVNPLPIVNAGNDTVVNIGEYITLQGTGNVDVGFLSPSTVPLNCNFCPTIIVNPYNTTCYTLMGSNQYYCYNFDEVCVTVLKDWDVYIPNTFTPNDDLKNEYFIPLGYGIEKINISIFDRWGAQLFKEENTTLGWDGKKNGKLCEQGIYIYHVEVFTLAGQKFIKTGHINLLPNLK